MRTLPAPARVTLAALLIGAALFQIASLQRRETLFDALPVPSISAGGAGLPVPAAPQEERQKVRPETPQLRGALRAMLRRARVAVVAEAVPCFRPPRRVPQCARLRLPFPEPSPHEGRAPPAPRFA
jgi:hypothetical protein